MFRSHYLQPGLLNDSNCCCLISVLLCLHRLCLINCFVDPNQMTRNGTPDFTILTLFKILRAMPSQGPFSLQTFITLFNRDGRRIQLGQNEDLYIAEEILKAVSLQQQIPVPVLTQYSITFFCPGCRIQHSGVAGQAFEIIPILPLPDQQQPVNPADLMTTLMNEAVAVQCHVCLTQINNATLLIVKGRLTIIRVNRSVFRNGALRKIMTPLDCGPSNSPGSQFLGELVAVVCHRTRPTLHWVSYSKADNGWYLNNDHQRPTPSSPFNSGHADETVNMLCYIN